MTSRWTPPVAFPGKITRAGDLHGQNPYHRGNMSSRPWDDGDGSAPYRRAPEPARPRSEPGPDPRPNRGGSGPGPSAARAGDQGRAPQPADSTGDYDPRLMPGGRTGGVPGSRVAGMPGSRAGGRPQVRSDGLRDRPAAPDGRSGPPGRRERPAEFTETPGGARGRPGGAAAYPCGVPGSGPDGGSSPVSEEWFRPRGEPSAPRGERSRPRDVRHGPGGADREPRAGQRDRWEEDDEGPAGVGRPSLGGLPGRLGIAIMAGGAAAGTVATIALHAQPGLVLGGFVVAGTLAAGLAVRPSDVRLTIPAPAIGYVIAAIIAGIAGGSASGVSRTLLGIHAVQWIAAGFYPMAAGTLLAVALTVGRTVRARRNGRPSGRGHAARSAGTGAPASRARSRLSYR